MIQALRSTRNFDTVVVGGGVLGLWAARHAIQSGEKVLILDKRHLGAGASGGFLGALMPHMPNTWNSKKQFQFDGLSTLGDAISELEDDTGHACGFRRCGRIMPVAHEKLRDQVYHRIEGAKAHWVGAYEMALLGADAAQSGWINPEFAEHGLQYDTLSARVNPRDYMMALERYIRPRCEVWEGVEAIDVQPHASGKSCDVVLADRSLICGGKVIVANGWEAYGLLQRFFTQINKDKPIGRGVKGQAVLVQFEHGDDLPIVYHDGVYVVPHSGNKVAIGSTSLNDWDGEPDAFDVNDMTFYTRALQLVPALANAPILEQWAGVRPRNTLEGRGTSPWFGPVPEYPGLIALIGGFKITLGLAHRINFLYKSI
ncbi:MAG: FAD-dependent oxidoreductase [Pseudomonadota bacterium]